MAGRTFNSKKYEARCSRRTTKKSDLVGAQNRRRSRHSYLAIRYQERLDLALDDWQTLQTNLLRIRRKEMALTERTFSSAEEIEKELQSLKREKAGWTEKVSGYKENIRYYKTQLEYFVKYR